MANFNYINRNNEDFFKSIKEFYIDKTNLISFTNTKLDTESCLICVSRPRRFGKSITAKMLNAYYSKGCDSKGVAGKIRSELIRDLLSAPQSCDSVQSRPHRRNADDKCLSRHRWASD